MTVLNAAKRKSMPKSEFAGPGKTFPENDPTHDRMAISGATRSFNAGNISKSEEEKIQGAARRKLGISPMHKGSGRKREPEEKKDKAPARSPMAWRGR
jgi:hypothetical protein